jgi:uncharacterized repeat protein (TIGR01451 family)
MRRWCRGLAELGGRWRIAGLVTALLVLALSAPGAQAAGSASIAFSPATFNYGMIAKGSTATEVFTLKNAGGSATANVTVALTGSSAFSKTVDACSGRSLGPKQSCSVTVAYHPTMNGAKDSATLKATVKKSAATATAALTGSTPGKADLSITKSDGTSSVVAGTTTTYKIKVANAGPNAALGAAVADSLPAGVSSDSWTAKASGGATGFSASGTGNLSDTVNLPAGSSITYSLVADLTASATGSLVNTATVGAPAGVSDPNASNNSATDTDAISAQADLAITKSDGATSVVPGTATTYTIKVSNFGPSDALGAAVVDALPAGVSGDSWTATASGGATGFSASGTGNLSDTVNLPAGSSIVYSLVADVSASATGSLVNTATVGAPAGVSDPNASNNSATDTDAISAQADLAITKSDGTSSLVPATSTTYTIKVSNFGPSDALGAAVADSLPAGVSSDSWTATASGGATGFSASGTGNLSDTVNLPAGSSITYSLVADLTASATGSLVNTATVGAPAGVSDPNSSNNSATDTDTISAPVDHLAVMGPALVTAGQAQSITVVALDAANDLVPSYAGTIHFTSSDGSASLPADYTFTPADAGVHTFVGGVTLTTAGSQSVTATDLANGSITGSEITFVDAASAATFSVTGISSPTVVGSPQTVTVTVEDPYGNVVTGYFGTIRFTSTDRATGTVLPADYTFMGAGTHTFTNGVTLTTPGLQTVTATDTTTTSITGSETVTVAPDTVTVTNPGNQTSTEGEPADLQIVASDLGGASLTYSATGLPTGLSINAATGVISGAPFFAGTSSVTVTATDQATGVHGSASFTWVVNAPPPACTPTQLLLDPGFEVNGSSWTTTAGVIQQNSSLEVAHTGTWFAYLDGYGTTHTDMLSQTVTLPSGCFTYTFSFWLHIDTAETSTTTAFDKLTVQAGSTTLATFSNLDHQANYQPHSYSLAAFAGQTVTLTFKGTEDVSLQTSFVIDDTAVNVS